MEVKFEESLERGRPGAVIMLKRTASIAESALEYEADQKHTETIVNDFGQTKDRKGVATPGVLKG